MKKIKLQDADEEWVESDTIEWMIKARREAIDPVTGTRTMTLYDKNDTVVEWTGNRDPEPSSVKNTAYPVPETSTQELLDVQVPYKIMIYHGSNIKYVTEHDLEVLHRIHRQALIALRKANPRDPNYDFLVNDVKNTKVREIDVFGFDNPYVP